MIEVNKITKEFGSIKAVSNVTFSVDKGEILGFLGPNGAGKSTTMRILAGIFPPTQGQVRISGFDLNTQVMEVRKRIGYLPEQMPLYPELTVSQYLDFVVSFWDFDASKKRSQIEKVIDQCGLESVKGALLKRLSRGYRQRVGLAQALVHDPEVLILDEPTVGLDPKQIRDIRDLIKSFQGKKTVILSTHILPEVSMTCQKVLIIDKGTIIAEGTPESLTQQMNEAAEIKIKVEGPPEEVRAALTGVPGIKNVEALGKNGKGSIFILKAMNGTEVRPQIAKTIVERNWGLLEMNVHTLSLEEIFVKLVTKEETL